MGKPVTPCNGPTGTEDLPGMSRGSEQGHPRVVKPRPWPPRIKRAVAGLRPDKNTPGVTPGVFQTPYAAKR
jgi:hypothetical protein